MQSNVVRLDQFHPRSYQIPLVKAFESGKYKRFLVVWPRRAGKEICAINLVVRAAFKRIGTYYIVYPNFSSGRRILCIYVMMISVLMLISMRLLLHVV